MISETRRIARLVRDARTHEQVRDGARPLIAEAKAAQRGAPTQVGIIAEWKTIQALRETRREHQTLRDPLTKPLEMRLRDRLMARCRSQARQRAVSTPTGWEWTRATISDYDATTGQWVVHGEYWYEYSRREGSHLNGASYLCGRDDGQDWCVRVPKTITKVSAALEWHLPAAVRKAQAEGRNVRRQGDVWFVQLKRGQNNLNLPWGHNAELDLGNGTTVTHKEHATVTLDAGTAWRSYQARTLDGQAD